MEEEKLLEHISWLARIEIGEEEKRELVKRLEKVKKFIDKLLEAEVEDIEPLYHPLEDTGYLREDKPTKSIARDKVYKNATKVEEGYIVAPRTMEE